jgi:hypothetical protein
VQIKHLESFGKEIDVASKSLAYMETTQKSKPENATYFVKNF